MRVQQPSRRSPIAVCNMVLAAVALCLLGCGADESSGSEVSRSRTGGPAEVGTIRANLGGEDRVWLSLHMENDRGREASSNYSTRTIARNTAHFLSIGGNVAASAVPNGSLRMRINSTQPFDSCPCTFENQALEYVVELPNDLYEARDAVITLDRFEPTGEATYEGEGSFRGTLVRNNDPSDTLPVHGTFDIDLILALDTGG